jgi:hypothetical protein
MDSVDGITVAVVGVSSELPVANVEVASELVESMEVVASVVEVVVVAVLAVVAAVLDPSTFVEVVIVISGQHKIS